jgi:hypothetical protein
MLYVNYQLEFLGGAGVDGEFYTEDAESTESTEKRALAATLRENVELVDVSERHHSLLLDVA